MIKLKQILNEKFSVESDKYINLGGKSVTSIPDNRKGDYQYIVFDSPSVDYAHVYINKSGKIYLVTNKYDKTFKDINQLVSFLNKNKFRYVGIDDV